jgi:hypothetical protein
MINLVVLNITSYAGQCADATHVYGSLILCDKDYINVDNVTEHNVKYIGQNIELRQPLTMEIAKKLDEKDGGKHHQQEVELILEQPGEFDDMKDWGKTGRFDTFEEVENFAIDKWKELGLDCPFISLYEGDKYDFKDHYTGEICKTKIIL